MVITRKIQISSQSDEFWALIRKLNSKLYMMANRIVSEQYYNDTITTTHADPQASDYWKQRSIAAKALAEQMGTSLQNVTYRMLSQEFGDQVSSYVLAALNSQVVAAYKADIKGIAKGEKTQRVYRRGMPIPLVKTAFVNLTVDGFSLLKNPVYFVYGADLSDNKTIVERIVSGEYKMGDSAIKYDRKTKKCFLNLTVHIPVKDHTLNEDITCVADITYKCPILLTNNKNAGVLEIGDPNRLAMLRYQMDKRLKSLQGKLVYCKGGHGRKRKLKAIDHFHNLENNIAKTFNHQVTARLIQLVLKAGAKNLTVIQRQEELPEPLQQNMIRYWGHAMIVEKIKYKCALNGINFNLVQHSSNEE